MNETQKTYLALAQRIYDLDGEVYAILGSGLGRVFTGSREATVRELERIMGLCWRNVLELRCTKCESRLSCEGDVTVSSKFRR